MDKYLETYNIPKLDEEEADSLNRPIRTRENEAIIKNSWHTKALDWMASLVNFTKHSKKN